MADIESALISETAASNTAAVPDGAPNNFARTSTKSLFREIWAGIKREWNRTHFTLTSAGTAPAFTLSPTTAIAAAYITGQRYGFIAHDATGGAMTLNVSSRGAKKVFDVTGTTQLTTGAFIAGTRIEVAYNTALDGGSGGFVWLNPFSAVITGANITGLSAETALATDDLIVISDTSESGAANKMTVENFKKGIIPVGMVVDYGAATAPTGWLLCYGQNVSRTTYAALFAIIGTTFGAGDGSTTFGIPDYRGRTGIGKDDMGGSGANRVTVGVSGITGTTLGNAGGDERLHGHSHTYTRDDPGTAQPGAAALNSVSAPGIATSTTGAGSSQNMPPSIVVTKIIFAGV